MTVMQEVYFMYHQMAVTSSKMHDFPWHDYKIQSQLSQNGNMS